MPDAQTLYPARYYAIYDTHAPQPTQVTGWYDTWDLSSTENLPPASEMIPIMADDWADRKYFVLPTGRGVKDGTIIDYTPPPYVPPLKERAQNALQQSQQQANMATAMGEVFGPQMRDYVRALQALLNGEDTTTTDLPQAPQNATD